MTAAIQRGLSLSDFNDMTIGAIVDYCKSYNHSLKKEDKDNVIQAEQRHFDNF